MGGLLTLLVCEGREIVIGEMRLPLEVEGQLDCRQDLFCIQRLADPRESCRFLQQYSADSMAHIASYIRRSCETGEGRVRGQIPAVSESRHLRASRSTLTISFCTPALSRSNPTSCTILSLFIFSRSRAT
jgi:hypothetical protein